MMAGANHRRSNRWWRGALAGNVRPQLYGQFTVNAGELLSDFMMAKNDANTTFYGQSGTAGMEVAALGGK